MGLRDFDFWLGEWDCRWDGGAATNTVAAELGGAVVVERFAAPDLQGLSVSVYAGDEWRQTWVDSQRSFLTFAGGMIDDVMELRSPTHRMRFVDIARDSLTWLWERQEGGGWKLLWRIEYARRA